jgi:hypothetical protein
MQNEIKESELPIGWVTLGLVAGERFAVGRPGHRPGRDWRRLCRQAGQDGPEHSLRLAVDGLRAVEADEAVGDQHGESVHGGPDHELGAGARRGRQAAGVGEPVKLGSEHVVRIIDTGLGPRNGAQVLDQARRLAGGRPLYLTTTHFHPEHGFGAQAFRGAATIIYNAAQRVELRRKGPGYVEMFTGMSPAYAAELRDVELTGPDITYDGRAEIDLGGHTAVLQSRGPAHTASDQSIHVDNRVLCALKTRPKLTHLPPEVRKPARWHWLAANAGGLGSAVPLSC